MTLLITFSFFLITLTLLVLFRASKRPFAYSWATAAIGSVGIMGSILAWQLELPYFIAPFAWLPGSAINNAVTFHVDTVSWFFSLSFSTLLCAVLLTSPVRTSNTFSPSSWIASIGFTGLGLVTVLAADPFTLVLGWAAMDLVELINLLRLSDSSTTNRRAISGFAFRTSGTLLTVLAGVLMASGGQRATFDTNSTPLISSLLFLSAGLRLGVIPLHITLRSDHGQRRGFGTILRLITAASSIILIVRVSGNPPGTPMSLFLLPFIGAAGLYSAWNWLTVKGEIPGRPFFIIAMSSLAMAAAIGGNSNGAAIWGVGMVLFGGLSFLYSARRTGLSILLGVTHLLLVGSPYSFSATAWQGSLPLPWLFTPIFIIIFILLMVGSQRHLFEQGEMDLQQLPIWAQSIFPIGMFFLPFCAILTGLWGWEGSLAFGNIVYPILLILVFSGIGFIAWKARAVLITLINLPMDPFSSLFFKLTDMIGAVFKSIMDLFVSLFTTLSILLEGDGGLLWIAVVIVLVLLSLRVT